MTRKAASKLCRLAVLQLFKRNLRAGKQNLYSEFEDELDLTTKELDRALDKLFREKKLERFGNEILPYKKGFRFPEDIRFVLRCLLRNDIYNESYWKANEIIEAIEKSVDKAGILGAAEATNLWGKDFPFVQPDTAKYLHRHFGYLAKINGTKTVKRKKIVVKRTMKMAIGKKQRRMQCRRTK